MSLHWVNTEGRSAPTDGAGDGQQSRPDVHIQWRARDSRLGHGPIITYQRPDAEPEATSPCTLWIRIYETFKRIGKGVFKMFITFPYQNLGFWSAFWYAWGSVLFIIGSLWAWQPEYAPKQYSKTSVQDAILRPIFIFVGMVFYCFGATSSYWTAINNPKSYVSRFQAAVTSWGNRNGSATNGNGDRSVTKLEKLPRAYARYIQAGRLDADQISEEIRARSMSDNSLSTTAVGSVDICQLEKCNSINNQPFRPWPTWHELRTQYRYDIAYLAHSIQGIGATIFGGTGITLLLAINPALSVFTGETSIKSDLSYSIPQMVASACFIIASVLLMSETQEKWYKPRPDVPGWWVASWALVGSCGFM